MQKQKTIQRARQNTNTHQTMLNNSNTQKHTNKNTQHTNQTTQKQATQNTFQNAK